VSNKATTAGQDNPGTYRGGSMSNWMVYTMSNMDKVWVNAGSTKKLTRKSVVATAETEVGSNWTVCNLRGSDRKTVLDTMYNNARAK
jgi:hypothetical protein